MLGAGPAYPLRLGDSFAKLPQGFGLGLAGRDNGVVDHAGLHGGHQDLLQRRARIGRAWRRRRLDEDVPGVATGQGRAGPGHMFQHQGHGLVGDDLEALQGVVHPSLQPAQQVQGPGGLAKAHPGHRPGADARREPEAGGGDDP